MADRQSALASAEHDLNNKEEQIKRNEAEIASCREDIHKKVEEVSCVGNMCVNCLTFYRLI